MGFGAKGPGSDMMKWKKPKKGKTVSAVKKKKKKKKRSGY